MAASNGFVHSGYDDGEDKPMLLMKKNGSDGHGITALINRQLQGNYFFRFFFSSLVFIFQQFYDFTAILFF